MPLWSVACCCQVTKSDCNLNCLLGMEKSPGFAKLLSQAPGSLGQVARADQLLWALNHGDEMKWLQMEREILGMSRTRAFPSPTFSLFRTMCP